LKHPQRIAASLCAALLLLSGCDGVGGSAEDRIGAAMPVGVEILSAKDGLDALAKSQALDAKSFDEEYEARLKVRALECGHGYQPPAFADAEEIRAALSDKDCFVSSDRALLEWLGQRRIAWLLAAPALRPLPKSAPSVIVASDFIQNASFAERAGVVLVQSSRKYQAIDIGTGETLASGETASSPAHSLSANGRLFLTSRERDTQVHETETGAVLATFAQVESQEFHWVGALGAIFKPAWRPDQSTSRMQSPVFLDFATGQQSTIPMSGSVSGVIALPGDESRVAVLAFNKLGEIKIIQGPHGRQAKLLSERPLPTSASWARNSSGVTADGRFLFGAGQSLQLLDLTSLDTRSMPFDPLRLQSGVATADPDRLLLGGYFASARGAGIDYGLYSLSQRTMASVDSKQFLSNRIIYIASLHRNAVIEESKIVLLDAIAAAEPLALNDYLEQRELAYLERANAAAMAQSQSAWSMSIGPPSLADSRYGRVSAATAPAIYPGPVAELGKTARVEAIGVYEGESAGAAAGQPRRTGTVQVLVMPSSQPIILSLSSYESVRWVLSIQPGAKLAAVLSSGYSQSEVFGAGSARVYQIGRQYAYSRGGAEFDTLDTEVAHWTGKRIGVFQGKYKGTTFAVGK